MSRCDLKLSIATLAIAVLVVGPAVAAQGARPAAAGSQCPTISTFISRLGTGVLDLGGSDIVDEEDAAVEPLGSTECPVATATKCEKLEYMSFMLTLMDMSPKTYRRNGMAALLANLSAEDAGLGDKCSAERLTYGGDAIRRNFGHSLNNLFCKPGGPGHSTAQAAGMVAGAAACDTSDEALSRLKAQIMTENPLSLTNVREYSGGFGPIVTRIYRYKNNLATDTDAFGYRGRGFIQITGRENYQICQNDLKSASEYMRRNPVVARAARTATGVDWEHIDVIATPRLVSQNRYVGAFCAASYWNHAVAPAELSWTDPNATFSAIFYRINTDGDKIPERYRGYTRWCDVAKCDANAPASLDIPDAFGRFVLRKSTRGKK
jgi:predicted chitinase